MNKLQLTTAAALSAVVLLSGAANAQSMRDLSGRWLLDEGGVLVINGSRWHHPRHGTARIRYSRDGADFEVHYQHNRTRCRYRVNFTNGGDMMVLEPTDVQRPGYCPEGRLRRSVL